MATRSQIILKNNKHVIDATGHRDVKSQRPWSRWPLATSQAPPSHSPPLPFHTSAYKSCRRVNGTPNGSNGRAYTNAVLSNIYLSAGPASHAHPVASKRPPAPTPGHYRDAHPDLLERSLPVLVRWVGSLHVTEHPVNHEARRGSLPPLALRALMYMHVSRPTVLPAALAYRACTCPGPQSYHPRLRAVPACVACGSQGILCKRRVVRGASVCAWSPPSQEGLG